jgi:hypothetical protein
MHEKLIISIDFETQEKYRNNDYLGSSVNFQTKLTAGLAGLGVASPSEKALRDLRRRLGPAPLKTLFEVVAGPLAQPHTPGVRFGGLRTVAFDGGNSGEDPRH